MFDHSFLQARNYIKSLAHMPKRNFADVFIGANPLGNLFSVFPKSPLPPSVGMLILSSSLLFAAFQAVDLLEKMLVLDTDKRITASKALAHPYFAQYHDPDDEPEADTYDQSFESRELEIDEWKSKPDVEFCVSITELKANVTTWKYVTSICWSRCASQG